MHPGLLCTAVRNLLVTGFSAYSRLPLTADQIQITPSPGKPFAFSGEWFVAVHGNDWSSDNDDTNRGLDYRLGVSVTVTKRTANVPYMKRGTDVYAAAYVGLSAVCLKVIQFTANKTTLFTELAGLDEYKYWTDSENDGENLQGQLYEYLRFLRCDSSAVEVYDDWFSAVNQNVDSDGYGEKVMGHTMTVELGRARCGLIQT